LYLKGPNGSTIVKLRSRPELNALIEDLLPVGSQSIVPISIGSAVGEKPYSAQGGRKKVTRRLNLIRR
jgi:hypothetical protein